jgi:hypothetical protein
MECAMSEATTYGPFRSSHAADRGVADRFGSVARTDSLRRLDVTEVRCGPSQPAAHAVFARQHGVASTRQLVDAGVSLRQIQRLQRHGDLELVLRGAYRTPSVPITELSRCAAVCLARPDVAIAGPTAGRLWGFRRLPPDQRIHVIAPRAATRRSPGGSFRIAPTPATSTTSASATTASGSRPGLERRSIWPAGSDRTTSCP